MLDVLDTVLPLLAAGLLMFHTWTFSYQTLGQPAHETTGVELLNALGLCVSLAWFLYFWA